MQKSKGLHYYESNNIVEINASNYEKAILHDVMLTEDTDIPS